MAKKTESNGTEQQHEVKIEKFERNLLVKLSDKEKQELAERTAYLIGEIDALTDDKKTAAKHAQAQIDEKKAELKNASNQYRDGSKFEAVKCERRFIFRTGTVQEVRVDTGEVMHERPMSERERQLPIPGVDGGADNDDGEEERLFDESDDEPESAPLPTQKRKGGRKKKGEEATAP